MKTIEQIYDQYQIMPHLREHMYRVTAVASIICDHFKGPLDRKSIIQACLLHDMGNIIKFDLSLFPEFLEPEGKEYWERIQKSLIEKYHTIDEHVATLAIAVEVEASLRTLELLHSSGFQRAATTNTSNEFEKKICLYADMRVHPMRVTSLDERLADMASRYANAPGALTAKDREEANLALHNIEAAIFSQVDDITPSSITEELCQTIVPSLKGVVIH